MEIITYNLKKLSWKGMVELRELEVIQCIEAEASMRVRLGKEVMILSPEELKHYIERVYMKPEHTPSKVGYWLRSYPWKP